MIVFVTKINIIYTIIAKKKRERGENTAMQDKRH